MTLFSISTTIKRHQWEKHIRIVIVEEIFLGGIRHLYERAQTSCRLLVLVPIGAFLRTKEHKLLFFFENQMKLKNPYSPNKSLDHSAL